MNQKIAASRARSYLIALSIAAGAAASASPVAGTIVLLQRPRPANVESPQNLRIQAVVLQANAMNFFASGSVPDKDVTEALIAGGGVLGQIGAKSTPEIDMAMKSLYVKSISGSTKLIGKNQMEYRVVGNGQSFIIELIGAPKELCEAVTTVVCR